jgi:signal transduction histidine kinase
MKIISSFFFENLKICLRLFNLSKIFSIFDIVILSIFFTLPVFAQSNLYNHKIVIDYIKVNNEKLDETDTKDILISSKDSITFYYHCDAGKNEKSPFLFKIKIKYKGMDNVKNINDNILTYSGLNEGQYDLIIGAFANDWTADQIMINFRVNDKEASLKNEVKELKKIIENKDSLDIKKGLIKLGDSGLHIYSILIGAAFTILIALVVYYILSYKKRKKLKSLNVINKKGVKMEGSETIALTKENFDRFSSEISNLKAEISSLRGQIDALLTRSEELSRQNLELKDTTDKLMLSRKEFEDLQKQKEDLFAIIIHDLKNPVSLVKSLVELLRSYDLTVNEQQEIINDIFDTTSKIVSLSQEVSRILVLEGSSLKLNFDYVQINDIIRDVHRRNSVAANNKSIDMLLDINDSLPQSQVDPQKIDEILDNLLSNAIKFSNTNGQIRIKSYKSDDNLVIEISDNGQGLSEDDVKKAFQRGGKLSTLPTAGEPSSGFGLWIVKKLVEAHKGRVWVKSVLGKGATFAFSVPIFGPEE